MKLIPLGRGKFAKVNDRFYNQLVRLGPWCLKGGYARKTVYQAGRFTTISMHKEVWRLSGRAEVPKVDHKNGKPLDNQLGNLRPATDSQNAANRRRLRLTQSGYKGVTKNKTGWIARVQMQGIRITIGTFRTRREAARAYDHAAKSRHGQFARLNFSEAA